MAGFEAAGIQHGGWAGQGMTLLKYGADHMLTDCFSDGKVV